MRPICDGCLRPALVFVKRSSAIDPGKFLCSRHLEMSSARADQFELVTRATGSRRDAGSR